MMLGQSAFPNYTSFWVQPCRLCEQKSHEMPHPCLPNLMDLAPKLVPDHKPFLSQTRKTLLKFL